MEWLPLRNSSNIWTEAACLLLVSFVFYFTPKKLDCTVEACFPLNTRMIVVISNNAYSSICSLQNHPFRFIRVMQPNY